MEESSHCSTEESTHSLMEQSSHIPTEQFLECEKEFWKMMSSLIKRLPKQTVSNHTNKPQLPMKIEMDTAGFLAFRGMFDRNEYNLSRQ